MLQLISATSSVLNSMLTKKTPVWIIPEFALAVHEEDSRWLAETSRVTRAIERRNLGHSGLKDEQSFYNGNKVVIMVTVKPNLSFPNFVTKTKVF